MKFTPLVTAVIPLYNSAKTIDETLRSVRAQTYRNIEVVVIDDGSTDESARIAQDHEVADPRVRLIRQVNAGVAAARNRGVAEAKSEFIAPIDADDLWEPTKIEKQMAMLLHGGPKVGLVYTWTAIINEKSQIISSSYRPSVEGQALEEILQRNFVGSGSPALMRKQAILDAGQYDTYLPQGCEDWLLYIQIAKRYEFAVVREFLTGYRRSRGQESANALRMLHSYDVLASQLQKSFPEYSRQIERGREHHREWLFVDSARRGNVRMAARLFFELFVSSPWFMLKFAVRLTSRAAHQLGNSLQRARGREVKFGAE